MRRTFLKDYGFIFLMLLGILGGCITGLAFPQMGARFAPLGTIFTNLMFCIVVPVAFCSIASAIADMKSARKAGGVMAATILIFCFTAAIAAAVTFLAVYIFPPVSGVYDLPNGQEIQMPAVSELFISFFTKSDFPELWSREAILPLIVFAVLFGFGIQMNGGPETKTARFLADLTGCLLKTVKIITWYAPVGFFGFFANLAAVHGTMLIRDYGRAVLLYYILSAVYVIVFYPLYAWFGGGFDSIRCMARNFIKPAAVAFGTCSSVATIPVNLEAAEETGIPADVSKIVIPLGATMHMDGSAMSAIIKVAFLFGLFGREFNPGQTILAILVAVLSSVAMSGIPGGGGTGELALCTIFFPEQMAVAYPLALALGNLIDPPATMVNAAGDYVVSFIVARFTDGRNWYKHRYYAGK